MSIVEVARIYLFVFGVLTIAGGVLGFVKAKSRPSLVAGLISGVSLLIAGYMVGWRGMVGMRDVVGLALGLFISFSLAGRFIGAYKKSGKFMPAGLMSILGITGVVITTVALIFRSV